MISVIIPVHKPSPVLDRSREMIGMEKEAELVMVLQNNLQYERKYENETIIDSGEIGRGNNFVKGIRAAKGDVLLLLHCDTYLPGDWHSCITCAMEDPGVSGGAFRLKFSSSNFSLDFLIGLSDVFYYLTGELWGDRALFIRGDLARKHLELINVPIMEDVRLSGLMRQHGRISLLGQAVVSSPELFLRYGLLRRMLRIMKSRSAYFLGMRPDKIYRMYYAD